MNAVGRRSINKANKPARPYGPPQTRDQGEYVEMFLVLLMAASALLAFSLLMPDSFALVMQELIGWGLAVGVGVLAVLAARQAFTVLLAVDDLMDD